MLDNERAERHEFCDKCAIGRGAVHGLIGGLLCWAVGCVVGWAVVVLLHAYVLR